MPLFRRSPTPPTPAPVQETAPPRKRGTIFSSSRGTDNEATTAPAARTVPPNVNETTRRRGFFRRRSTGSSDVTDSTQNRHNRRGSVGSGSSSKPAARTGSMFGHSVRGKDRSLEAAMNKVTLAEKAEKEADIALATARKAVVEARRHVQTLEEEVNEQARLAHEKVLGVRSLKDNASGLGRHMEK